MTIPHEVIKTQLLTVDSTDRNNNLIKIMSLFVIPWKVIDDFLTTWKKKKNLHTYQRDKKNALCEPCNEAAKLKWQQHLQKKNNTGIVPVALLVVAA